MSASGRRRATATPLAGAELIGTWLPRSSERPTTRRARAAPARRLPCRSRAWRSMLALGHALAQALGGRYGAPHGALNALTRRRRCASTSRWPARRSPVRHALGRTIRPVASRSCAPRRLRAPARPRHPRGAATEVVEAVAGRAGAKANPREVTPADAEALIRSIW